MKKVILMVLVATCISSCSWFKSGAEWADNTFFEPSTPPNNAGSGYPYYYSSMAPIDANEQPGSAPVTGQMVTGYPAAAPGSMGANPYAIQPSPYGNAPSAMSAQNSYNAAPNSQQPASVYSGQPYNQQYQYNPPAQAGGYGVPANQPTTSINLHKGSEVNVQKQAPTLPPLKQSPAQGYQQTQPYGQQPMQQPQQYQQPVQQQMCYNQMGQQVPCGMPAQPQYQPQVQQYDYPVLPK